MTEYIKKAKVFYQERNINSWLLFFFLVYIIFVMKFVSISRLEDNFLFSFYSLAVAMYILSRFALAYFYEPRYTSSVKFSMGYEPTVTFAVPAKNEGERIRETLLRIIKSDYPKHKFDVVAINDGSTDNTLEEMEIAKRIAVERGVSFTLVNWKKNRGKRDGMAECTRLSKNEIIVFIDSDSFVEPNTAREFVKYFVDPGVGAVAGQAYVTNAEKNILTKMQSVRYFVAFRAYKAAEALFGMVTCCSGCCSAYRRSHVMEVLDEWVNQKFLGVKCTYGDDRSLTNMLLKRNRKALFAAEATATTYVPDTFRVFMKQQLRWKKSWVRESVKAGGFIWRKNPIMSISFYMGLLLPLFAPVVVVRAFFWYPIATGRMPYFYLLGLVLMAMLYGLYYYIYTKDRNWVYGVLFATFYTLVLMWQLPYAILNIRDPQWGTR